jgi:hypothetical protein
MTDKQDRKGLERFASLSEEEHWKELECQFAELSEVVHMRLETQEEAVEETYPEWHDEEVGRVRAWLLIPFRRAFDQENLRESQAAAQALEPELRSLFEARTPSVKFLDVWGRFCSFASVLESLYANLGSRGRKPQRNQWLSSNLANLAVFREIDINVRLTHENFRGSFSSDLRGAIFAFFFL